MKVIKTNWRSNLKDSTLSDLMVIKIESEPILTVVMSDDEKGKTVDVSHTVVVHTEE